MTPFHDSLERLDARQDDDLKAYFASTRAVEALADFKSKKVLGIGLKGIGKTAAFRYLTEFGAGDDLAVIGINQHKYQLSLPNRDLNYSTYRNQFEHDMVIEALRILHESRDRLQTRNTRPLFDKAAAQFAAYRTFFPGAASRFGGVSILGFGFTLLPPETPVLVGLRPQSEIDAAFIALSQICQAGVKVRIVIDDPELVFSASQILNVHLIGGLFLAALELSRKLENLKVVVLIKTHVFKPIELAIEDLVKYPDAIEHLHWSRDQLLEILEKRIRWAGGRWSDFFDGAEKCARGLVGSTMCTHLRSGPRELLRWCSLASRLGTISKTTVRQTAKDIAAYCVKSLAVSFAELYPRLDTVVAQIFRNCQTQRFALPDFVRRLEELQFKDPAMLTLWRMDWLQQETAYTLPKLLFETGSIALELDGKVVLPYESLFDPEHFDKANRIFLTPALAPAL